MNETLTGSLGKIWRKYLFAALGSAIITSIYATVDLVVIGQYEGPNGAAAMAVLSPLWSVIMSLGILFAVGGSVMLGVSRGAGDRERGDRFFSAALISSAVVSALCVALCWHFRVPLFRLFGASDELMPLVLGYGRWLIPFLPVFLIGQVLIFFLRNDEDPVRATVAVASCGILNIFGDIFFVFTLDMGIAGAGLATVLCQTLAFLILCTHFLSRKNTLRFVRPLGFFRLLGDILRTGLSPLIVDLSVFVATILFNNRIMRLAGATELAVYGTATNVSIFVLGLFYGVGGALQPIVSAAHGAGDPARIRQTLRLALLSAALIALPFLLFTELCPTLLLRAYMDVTPSVLEVGPPILRVFALGFFFTGVNVTASYHLQSVLCTRESLIVSLLRGLVFSAVFLFLLPALFGFNAIWWTTPLTEFLTAGFAVYFLKKQFKKTKEI